MQNKALRTSPRGSHLHSGSKQISIEDVRAELRTVEESKRQALKRWKDQRKSGQYESAAKSKQEYESCCQYASQLGHILEGYRTRSSGEKYFTKDMSARFRDSVTGERV